jgi:hypothetical protein
LAGTRSTEQCLAAAAGLGLDISTVVQQDLRASRWPSCVANIKDVLPIGECAFTDAPADNSLLTSAASPASAASMSLLSRDASARKMAPPDSSINTSSNRDIFMGSVSLLSTQG